jgi:hypothetical protein
MRIRADNERILSVVNGSVHTRTLKAQIARREHYPKEFIELKPDERHRY